MAVFGIVLAKSKSKNRKKKFNFVKSYCIVPEREKGRCALDAKIKNQLE